MVGPVLYQELLLGGRRSQGYWLRWVYGGWLMLLCLALLLGYTLVPGQPVDPRALGEFAREYVTLLVFQHFILLTLITPVVTASAISDEKWRGTLQYLLTSDLLAWEILTGKWLARVFQSLLILLAGLPVLAFLGTLAGLNLPLLLALCLASVLVAFGLAGAGLFASVWCRQTRDAVLGLYLVGAALYGALRGALVLLGPRTLPGWLHRLLLAADPIQPLGPDWLPLSPEELGPRLLACLVFWGVLGCLSLSSATLMLRWVYIRQLEATGKARKARWWRAQRPPVPRDPLRWKERYVEGLAPLGVLRHLPTWLGVTLTAGATACSSSGILLWHLPPGTSATTFLAQLQEGDFGAVAASLGGLRDSSLAFFVQGWVVWFLGTLIVGIRCSGAITGERERQTWESLLLTPLETRQLLRGKLWGVIGAGQPYLLAYALAALVFSAVGGVWALFWAVLMLGVTVLGMFYVGAAGLWCSAKCSTSWRSLLWTLFIAYVASFLLFVVTAVGGAILAAMIQLCLLILNRLLQNAGYLTSFGAGVSDWYDTIWIGFCLALAMGFVLMARELLSWAEYHINTVERTRNWQDYSFRHRPRRLPIRG